MAYGIIMFNYALQVWISFKKEVPLSLNKNTNTLKSQDRCCNQLITIMFNTSQAMILIRFNTNAVSLSTHLNQNRAVTCPEEPDSVAVFSLRISHTDLLVIITVDKLNTIL